MAAVLSFKTMESINYVRIKFGSITDDRLQRDHSQLQLSIFAFGSVSFIRHFAMDRNDVTHHPLFQYLTEELSAMYARLNDLAEENRFLHRRVESLTVAHDINASILDEYENRIYALEQPLRNMLNEPLGGTSYTTQCHIEDVINTQDVDTTDLQRLLDDYAADVAEDVDWFLEL